MAKLLAGVDGSDDAGLENDELDTDNLETGDYDDEGDADPEDADVETEDEGDDNEPDESEEEEPLDNPKSREAKAFAKRLAAKERQIADRLKAELTAEFEAKYGQQKQPDTKATPAVDPLYADMPPMTREQLEAYADQQGITADAAWVQLNQQHAINKLHKQLQAQQTATQQTAEERRKAAAIREVATQRKANPNLPAFSEAKIEKIRGDYQKANGTALPYMDAYRMMVADEVISGKTTRRVQQDTLNNVSKRDTQSVRAGSGGKVTPKSFDDMSEAEFEAKIAEARAGKLKSRNR